MPLVLLLAPGSQFLSLLLQRLHLLQVLGQVVI